ncbi:MAG: Maf family nucleotide pyrophosphatase [Gammaproteobacteria bacterium]
MKVVLASSSPYRSALLERLGLVFVGDPPQVDETPQAGESLETLVRRLARTKAKAAALRHRDSLIIACDQVSTLDGAILGKPGSHARAVAQLTSLSGRAVNFSTGLCVIQTRTRKRQEHIDTTRVQFRALTAVEIERYLKAEQPYNCAGSFKSEGLGISLFESIESNDPTALIGLPLIALCRCLREFGVALP